MNNIIWLASYPKSGNTWLRIFLTNLLQNRDVPADINQLEIISIASARGVFDHAVGIEAADLTHAEVDRLRPELYEYLSNQAAGRRFLKIHDAYTFVDGLRHQPLVSRRATRGAIYILRNPLDVALSFANHAGISVDESIERMANEDACFSSRPGHLHRQLRQRLLSWSGHVGSWIDAPDLDLYVMRYEDMHRAPMETFTAAARFAGLDAPPDRVNKALAFSAFREMQRQEQDKGFKEKPQPCPVFFRQGRIGDWQDVLDHRQVKQVIDKHGHMMRRCGYVDVNGEPCEALPPWSWAGHGPRPHQEAGAPDLAEQRGHHAHPERGEKPCVEAVRSRCGVRTHECYSGPVQS